LNLLHIPLPDLNTDGYLESGLYLVSLEETLVRFGSGSVARERLGKLLHLIIERARNYHTIKRVLVWGSFVSNKGARGLKGKRAKDFVAILPSCHLALVPL